MWVRRRIVRIAGVSLVGYGVVILELTEEDSLSLQRGGIGGRRKWVAVFSLRLDDCEKVALKRALSDRTIVLSQRSRARKEFPKISRTLQNTDDYQLPAFHSVGNDITANRPE